MHKALCLVALLTSALCAKVATVSVDQAKRAIGTFATVCVVVASSYYAKKSRGKPTFINLDKPYPNHIFTVVIWGEDRKKFKKDIEKRLLSKSLCVRGLIGEYRGVPQIAVSEPKQLLHKFKNILHSTKE